MPEAKIILFETNSRAHRVRRELEDWRRRLRLAYARQWDWRAARNARWKSVGSATWRATSRATTPNGSRPRSRG